MIRILALVLGILLLSSCAGPRLRPALELQACNDEKESLGLQIYLLKGQVQDLENRLVVVKEALRAARGSKP